MDGLNCNEIQYSELFPNNTIFRLDAEFFSREAITIEKKIKEISCFYLKPQEVVHLLRANLIWSMVMFPLLELKILGVVLI